MAGLYSEGDQSKMGLDSYAGASATRTKASSTLFVRRTPDALLSEIESLFAAVPGYLGVRTVRKILFVDYDSIKVNGPPRCRSNPLYLDPNSTSNQ